MDFRSCEVQPFLHSHPLHGAVCRREACGRLLIGKILNDYWPFGNAFAIVEFKNRYLAFAVDAPVVHAGLRLFLLIVDLLKVEIIASLAQHYMWRE
jgi:hypothetical protein